ncbi:MAG: cytochrome c biogenesis protein ResB [Limisphaerales bacterium]
MALKPLLDFFTSLRLTVVCLTFATVLVFIGTIAQVEMGIYAAQAKYFRSVFVFWDVPGTSLRIPVYPGGYLLGGLLMINLSCSFVRRVGFKRSKLGVLFIHIGLILLLLGQLATDLLSVESNMRLSEGESRNYSEDSRHSELVIVDTTDPSEDAVVAIPDSVLAHQREIANPALPFTIRVLHYWRNSTNIPPAMVSGPSLATQGLGAGPRFQFAQAPLEPRMDRRNVPTAYVELIAPSGSLGTWMATGWIDDLQSFTHSNRTYAVGMRLARYYKPFSLQLAKFSHDKYMGTEIPKNFSSRVRVLRPETGEDREVLIYMNNPLRYGGETFYQSGYDERDPRVTILQVVRNPGWLTPYLGCVFVGLGLSIQFTTHLLGFVKRRTP